MTKRRKYTGRKGRKKEKKKKREREQERETMLLLHSAQVSNVRRHCVAGYLRYYNVYVYNWALNQCKSLVHVSIVIVKESW